MSTPPVWIDARAILFLHDESLAMFGGARGLRDAGLFESALSRPVNQHLYKPDTDIAELAAAYAFGLAKNHPFVDGNKRTAFAALFTFLALNGMVFEPPEVDATMAVLRLAASEMDDNEFTDWVRAHTHPPA